MEQLIALRVSRAETGRALERVWAEGDAALVLPEDASARRSEAQLDALRPAAVVTVGPDGREERMARADPAPIDARVALVVATSGTTGAAKGVELTHDALAASVTASLDRLGAVPGQRLGLALPTHHVAGVLVHLRARALGTAAVTAPDTDSVGHLDVEHVALVPTQLARLLERGAPVDRFTSILLGGAAPPAGLVARARDVGARVVLSYGMTETCGGCVYDGVPLDPVDVEVVGADAPADRQPCDVAGRIRVRGPVLLHGYRTRTAEGTVTSTSGVDADGWFTTGDLGRLVPPAFRDPAARPRLEVLGRADAVLVSGGENVPIAAVTTRLCSHPDVADAAVAAALDPRWGQVPVAVIVPRDPEAVPGLEELRAHVRRDAPAAFAPARVHVVETLPRDAMGKLSDRDLRGLLRTLGES
ncbi:MAG: AMP-binding protein [Nitriliruptoraceae bacterium]